MAKYGPIYSYWSRDWDVDIIEVVKRASKAGVSCMEIHTTVIENWSKDKLSNFKKLYEDLGIEVAYWYGFTPETNIISANPAIREEGVKRTIKYIKFNDLMEAKILDGTYVQPWNVELEGRTREEAVDTSVECLRKMADAAEDYGVTLCMEILNRFEGAILNTMEQAVEIIDRVGSKNVKITADSYHMNIEEDGIESALRLGGRRIGHFHLGEANRRLPGNGTQINWDELFGTLKELEYDGMFIFEGFVLHGGQIAKEVKLRRDLSNGADENQMTIDLKKSIRFVKEKFEK